MALKVAVQAHLGQSRDGKNGLPYAVHPISVANLVTSVGKVHDPTVLCAALLHDVLEESAVSPKQISKKFGKPTAQLVLELTREEPDELVVKKLTEGQLRELRSKMLLMEIRKMSPNAMLIKLADRIDNLREARIVRTGEDLRHYIEQSRDILKTIPKKVNPQLWDLLESEITGVSPKPTNSRSLKRSS